MLYPPINWNLHGHERAEKKENMDSFLSRLCNKTYEYIGTIYG